MASTSILNKNLIARVKADYSHGVTTDDTRLSDRLVYSILLMCRNELLAQKSDKKQSLSNWNYQTLSGIELEPVNPAECLGISIGCPILRSKEELPTILSDKSGYMILMVSTIAVFLRLLASSIGINCPVSASLPIFCVFAITIYLSLLCKYTF